MWSDVRKLCYNVILLALSVECCIIHVLWPVGGTGDGSRLCDYNSVYHREKLPCNYECMYLYLTLPMLRLFLSKELECRYF